MANRDLIYGFADREIDLGENKPIQKKRKNRRNVLAVASFLSLGAFSLFMLSLMDPNRFIYIGAVIQTQPASGTLDTKALGIATVLLLASLLLTRALVKELALEVES